MLRARHLRSLLRSAIMISLGIGFGVAASLVVFAYRLSLPVPSVIGPIPADLPAVEDVRFPSTSGSLLHGWWMPAANPGGTVVLLHCLRANRLAMLDRARRLHGEGFSVLLFDFQAHGESPGHQITLGKLEALDAAAAVAFVHARRPADRVGAIGVSLGAAAALLGPEPLHVDALVLESVYGDIRQSFANLMRISFGRVLGPVVAPALVPLLERVILPGLGISATDLRPIEHIDRVTVPLLIAAGTEDGIAPLSEAQTLFDRAPEPKHFWPVAGADHDDLEHFAPGLYWATVLPFLQQSLHCCSPAFVEPPNGPS